MTTTKRGKLYIETDGNNKHTITFEPINNTVWMNKAELVELFGVYIQTINSHIEAIYKTKAFREEDTSKYDLYVSGNRIKYDMREFNLEVIIALAFRIDSWQAKVFRGWIINKLLNCNSIVEYPLSGEEQNHLLN